MWFKHGGTFHNIICWNPVAFFCLVSLSCICYFLTGQELTRSLSPKQPMRNSFVSVCMSVSVLTDCSWVCFLTQVHMPLSQSSSCGSVLPRALAISPKDLDHRHLHKSEPQWQWLLKDSILLRWPGLFLWTISWLIDCTFAFQLSRLSQSQGSQCLNYGILGISFWIEDFCM